MSDLRALYQEVILDHNRRPRNFRTLEDAEHAEGYNPLCGDQVSVFVRTDGGVITDIAFQGHGCAISTAAASMMTEAVRGKAVEEASALFRQFVDLMTKEPAPTADLDTMGKLAVFSGVREFPMRVKCATLCWHTLRNALEHKGETATTE